MEIIEINDRSAVMENGGAVVGLGVAAATIG